MGYGEQGLPNQPNLQVENRQGLRVGVSRDRCEVSVRDLQQYKSKIQASDQLSGALDQQCSEMALPVMQAKQVAHGQDLETPRSDSEGPQKLKWIYPS
jgi:hypothetical protein